MSDNNEFDVSQTIKDLIPEDLESHTQEAQEEPVLEPVEQDIVQDEVPEQEVQRARKFGHIDYDQWVSEGRDPSKWKDPKAFNEFADSYPELKSLRQEISKLNKFNDDLIAAQKKNAEEAYWMAKRELEQRLNYAEEVGDLNEVKRLTENKVKMEIEEQKTHYAQGITKEQEYYKKVNNAFIARNKHWYAIDGNTLAPLNDLTDEANREGARLSETYPNMSYLDILERVEKYMTFQHPELAVNQVHAPTISQSRSAINKSASDMSPHGRMDKQYKALSQEDQMDYQIIKEINENSSWWPKDKTGKPKSYTIEDFYESYKKNTKRGN